MYRSALFICCLLLAIARTCSGLEITFKPEVSVDGVSVSIADVADFDDHSELAQALASQIITQSPAPGKEIQLQTEILKNHLVTSLSIPSSVLWSGPATVRIYRNGNTVGPDKIQSIIAEFLENHRKELPEAAIRFLPASLPLPFMLPSGTMTWDVIPSHPGILSSSSISLIFRVDGQVRKNISIAGRIEALAPAVVAAASIPRGTILTADLVQVMTKNIAESAGPSLGILELVGKKTNRTIPEGRIIERAWIDIPPMVARGQVVKIIVQSGDLHVATEGIATMNGTKGQVIRVQNSTSKKLITGRVMAPGIVEVHI